MLTVRIFVFYFPCDLVLSEKWSLGKRFYCLNLKMLMRIIHNFQIFSVLRDSSEYTISLTLDDVLSKYKNGQNPSIWFAQIHFIWLLAARPVQVHFFLTVLNIMCVIMFSDIWLLEIHFILLVLLDGKHVTIKCPDKTIGALGLSA